MTPELSPPRRLALIGILSAVGGSLVFSVNDVAIKFLSGDYALHEVVLIRSIVGMTIMICCVLPFQGGFAALRTSRLGLHLLRALCVVSSNLFYFLGLLVFYLLMTKLSEIVLSRIADRLSKGQATAAGEAMRKAAI